MFCFLLQLTLPDGCDGAEALHDNMSSTLWPQVTVRQTT